jgi:retron-type reverse transcriptase
MQTYTNLYAKLCSYDNLLLAWKRARKRKTLKDYVIDFESDLEGNLKQLQHELETFIYSPAPLTTFIVKDPKTRKISASHFRDRVIHHAICNIVAPIFEKDFIYDSFANQKNKGTHIAIKRLEKFMRKVNFNSPSQPGGGAK